MLPNDTNYMLYRLTWNAERNKFNKKPCNLDGSPLHEGQPIPTASRGAIVVPDGCALGYWLREGSGLFFLDLDECVDPATGALSPDAARIAAPFVQAGCFFESSSSGRGAHIIGSHTGNLPAHANRRPNVHKYEFYTRDRGIALNLTRAVGSSSVDVTAAVLAMLPETFPPRAVTVTLPVGQRRPEWRGPEDDDELIRRALSATGSAAARFGSKATFADLWNGNVEHNSEADLALASHLAFWTGCDVERIERLMRRSALARPKWNEHRTYLRDITITHACSTTANVYQQPERRDVLAAAVGAGGTVDWFAVTDKAISEINHAGTLQVLLNDVLPTIPQLALPPIHAQRVVIALQKKLDIFDSKIPIGEIRRIVTPPTVTLVANDTPPEWFVGMCYIKQNDKFYNLNTGSIYSAEGFRTEFSRTMPMKPNGGREDPVLYARERWGIVTVDDTMYYPTQGQFFLHAGKQYANTFNPMTLPAITEPSDHCRMCIQAFQNHLYLLCGQRDWLYILLLQWLAHNVQHPGHKIRWSPLIKGVQGDGKSIVGDLIFAVMGEANVKITSPSNISNKGGFTDWATGKAINFIEEIRLEGKEKHALYNAMKLFVGDTRADVNRKGRAAGDTMPNVMNHWANTNYGDAIPVDPKERRWLIVFSPYHTIEEAAAAKGLPDADSLVRHFKMLGASMRAEPGAWRGWLMSLDTSSFDPDGRAPDTPERESMRLMSGNTMDQAIVDILEQGGHGITRECFSSSCLMGMVRIKTGDQPDTRGWNSTLTRLGYMQMTKTVWWSGSAHRIWAIMPMTNDEIREKLG